VPVWHVLAEAAIEAALLETHPRAITEMAFGFAPEQHAAWGESHDT